MSKSKAPQAVSRQVTKPFKHSEGVPIILLPLLAFVVFVENVA